MKILRLQTGTCLCMFISLLSHNTWIYIWPQPPREVIQNLTQGLLKTHTKSDPPHTKSDPPSLLESHHHD